MGKGGRSGRRFWYYGKQKKAFEGRQPASEFEELSAHGLLRMTRNDASTGTYFAFTPDAFRERDAIVQAERDPGGPTATSRKRPEAPPPELISARSRARVLADLKIAARDALLQLLDVSVVEDRYGDSFVITPYPWRWRQLPPADRPLQGNAKDVSERWIEAGTATLAAAGPEHSEAFEEHADTLRRLYIRSADSHGPVSGSLSGNVEAAGKALDSQFALIEELPGVHEAARLILVPDTNALLKNPDIEQWEVGDEGCEFIIVSQVQAELDAHKNNDRSVAEKAAKLIRKLKEYGRRGDTLTGVPLSGKRRIREIPLNPDMSVAPAWLDASNADDRILAATLEIASRSTNSTVVLVTRDRGLQNKARAAGLPAIDVDDL